MTLKWSVAFICDFKAVVELSYSDVVQRILEKSPLKTERALAERLGISPNTWTAYKKGKQSFSLDDIAKICDILQVDSHWLLFGSEQRLLDPAVGSGSLLVHAQETMNDNNRRDVTLPTDLSNADFVNLPQYDVRASAGGGLIAVNKMPVSEIALERSFLRDLGGAPDHCFVMWSKGDSMLPAIPDNALLIVDSSQAAVDHGRIYVFNVGNAVVVKRAKWRMDGRLALASDNIAGNYQVETFDADRVEDLTVVGRVIFVGHRS